MNDDREIVIGETELRGGCVSGVSGKQQERYSKQGPASLRPGL